MSMVIELKTLEIKMINTLYAWETSSKCCFCKKKKDLLNIHTTDYGERIHYNILICENCIRKLGIKRKMKSFEGYMIKRGLNETKKTK